MSSAPANPAPPQPCGHAHEAAAAQTASLELWREAREIIVWLHALFGAPAEIAFRQVFPAKLHRQACSWLRCAEAMLRRLLLIEAEKLPPLTRRARAPHVRWPMRRFAYVYPEQPEGWRVSFRCFQGTQAHETPSAIRAKRATPWRFRTSWPLAERMEAVFRVFNDPAPYARRLAWRLHARPQRLEAALAAPKEARHRIDRFEAMGERARAVWRRRFSSA